MNIFSHKPSSRIKEESASLGSRTDPGSSWASGGSEAESLGSSASASDERPTETDGETRAHEGESMMSDEQIEIFARTISNASEALERVPKDLARRIRKRQEDVADKRRAAQSNEDLLRMRIH